MGGHSGVQRIIAKAVSTFMVVLIVGASGKLQAQTSARFDFSNLPSAYIQVFGEKENQKFESKYDKNALELHRDLLKVEDRILGLTNLPAQSIVERATVYLYLEAVILNYHHRISTTKTPMLELERLDLLRQTVYLYNLLRGLNTVVYQQVIRMIDVSHPGATGEQIRFFDQETDKWVYSANYRSGGNLSDAEKQKFYDAKKEKFLKEGGRMDQIIHLNNLDLKRLSIGFHSFEFAQVNDKDFYLTESKAGHLLLSGGKSVVGAGQIFLHVNEQKQISFLVSSNSSGNYKTDYAAAVLVGAKMREHFRIPEGLVTTTQGEAFSDQMIRLILKSQNVDPTQAQKYLQQVTQTKNNILSGKFKILGDSAKAVSCQFAFAN